MNITVLGSGGWGTALALVLVENGHKVKLWCRRSEKCRDMSQSRENPQLKGIPLPPTLELTDDLACVKDCEVVVLATPSFAVRTTARQAKDLLASGTVVVSVSKGIEEDTSLTMTEVIAEELPGHPVAALSGPSHAEEVGRGVPTAVVAAAKDRAVAQMVQDIFMNQRFRVYTTDDVVGVELGAALKNVIALCAGVSDGLGLGDNTKAMLMTRGLTEIARLGEAMGGRKETFAGLAGIGDLIVTCTSMHSRNRRCGILVGQGIPPRKAVQQIGMVVEGYYAAATAKTLADKRKVEMPISDAAYQVLYGGKDPRAVVTELMTRDKKPENEESWV